MGGTGGMGMGMGMSPGAGAGPGGGGLLTGGGMQGLQSKFNDWKTGHPEEWSGIQSKVADLRSKLPTTPDGWQTAISDWKSKMPGAPAQPGAPAATPQAPQPQAAQQQATPQAGLLSATPQTTEGGDWQSQLPRDASGNIAWYAHLPPSMWSAMGRNTAGIMQGFQGFPEGFLEKELAGRNGEPGARWQQMQDLFPGSNFTDVTQPAGKDWPGPNGEPPVGGPPAQQNPLLPWTAHMPPEMQRQMANALPNLPKDFMGGFKGYPEGWLDKELAGRNGEPGQRWQQIQDIFPKSRIM